MKAFSSAAAGAVLIVALTGCSAPSDAPPLNEPPSTLSVTPSQTPSATPTPDAVAGTRSNPLQPGQSRKISEGSAWSVGCSAATVRGDGYIVFPLQVAIDWDAAREQAKATAPNWSPENEGLDPYGSLTVEFVSAAGRSYRTMDNYDVAISDQFYSLGTVYPPATTFNANVAVSVPADQIEGGTWVIKNPRGDSVFVAVG